jgi:hypothetical protein
MAFYYACYEGFLNLTEYSYTIKFPNCQDFFKISEQNFEVYLRNQFQSSDLNRRLMF